MQVSNPPINQNSASLVHSQSDVDTYVSVYEDSTRAWDSESTGAVDASNLFVEPEIGIIRNTQGWSTRGLPGCIKVTYYGGYATVPDALAHACEVQVAKWYDEDKNAAWAKVNESEAGASVTWRGHGDLAREVVDMLSLYDLGAQ